MAKLFPTLVAVKKISSSVPRSTFPEKRLERAARLILEAGGAITPPVVRKINFNAFEVIEGHFEYYAAVKAREIDPREGEMLGVFSIDPASEDAVSEDILTQQIEVFKNVTPTPVPDRVDPVYPASPALEQRVNNLETRFEEQLQKIQANYNSSIKDLQERIEDLEDRTPKAHPLLEALNHSSENELMSKLSSMSSINKKVLERILEALKDREQRPFSSFENLIERVNGLGHKTAIKVIDEWTSRGF